MAKKKSKNKNQAKPVEKNTTPSSTRIIQVIFLVISVMIVLSMILAATSSF
jgi:hypothetical protein